MATSSPRLTGADRLRQALEVAHSQLTRGDIQSAVETLKSLQLWRHNIADPDVVEAHHHIVRIDRRNRHNAESRIRTFLQLAERTIAMNRTAFIVHGWDNELKLAAKNYFQNTLGFRCVILHEQDSEGDVIINKFERYASEASIAVVLLSHRDEPSEALADPNALRRPRPNVLFEMGYFFSRLGRRAVLLLRSGPVEINSDILGIEYIDVSHGVPAAGDQIRRRLKWLGVPQ